MQQIWQDLKCVGKNGAGNWAADLYWVIEIAMVWQVKGF